MSQPVVTVITATYNSSATLRLTIASVLQQTFTDFELWVIGDACTDDSEAIVQAFNDPRVHWKNLDRNHGSQAAPDNEGLRLARGHYIAYLGHDDLWFPNHLEGLVNGLEANQADWVHSLCVLFDVKGPRDCIGPPKATHSYRNHFVPPSAWLHQKDILAKIGGWRDPNQLAWPVDFDVMKRIYQHGFKQMFVPQLTVLKFPSARFRAYSRVGTPPQLDWWQHLCADPEQTAQDVLMALAIQYAQQEWGGSESPLKLMTDALRVIKRQIQYDSGQSKLTHAFFRRYFQRSRKKSNRLRGLK